MPKGAGAVEGTLSSRIEIKEPHIHICSCKLHTNTHTHTHTHAHSHMGSTEINCQNPRTLRCETRLQFRKRRSGTAKAFWMDMRFRVSCVQMCVCVCVHENVHVYEWESAKQSELRTHKGNALQLHIRDA